MKLKYFLIGFGIIAIILTFMPYIAVDYWWIRMFDFPHLQLTGLTSLAILTYVIKFDFKDYRDYVFITVLMGCGVFQFYKIYPYTAFANYEVLNANKPAKARLSIFTANVMQDNEKTEKLIHLMDTIDADVMLFTEVNERWFKEIEKHVSAIYAYQVDCPLENTYGMVMYSKLPLIHPEVKFLVSDSIPSIHTKLVMNKGDTIQLYAIHPTPPMPQENTRSTDRDAEMMKIAKLSLASKIPVIVFGDFNDVAWSVTSKLFKKVSLLLDIRRGRGLYNTYNAQNFILRWPLDHVFISKEFRYITAKTCPDINSDHFPFYAELNYEPKGAYQQKPKPVSQEALQKAENQIKNK